MPVRTASWASPKGGSNEPSAPLSPSPVARRLETALTAAAQSATSGLLDATAEEARRGNVTTGSS